MGISHPREAKDNEVMDEGWVKGDRTDPSHVGRGPRTRLRGERAEGKSVD